MSRSRDIRAAEMRRYRRGLAGTVGLTCLAFGLAAWAPGGRGLTMVLLGALAVLQIATQFRCFLHIDLKRSHRDDLLLILFTGLIVVLMIGGTLWILSSQWSRMG